MRNNALLFRWCFLFVFKVSKINYKSFWKFLRAVRPLVISTPHFCSLNLVVFFYHLISFDEKVIITPDLAATTFVMVLTSMVEPARIVERNIFFTLPAAALQLTADALFKSRKRCKTIKCSTLLSIHR